jgi:hypothetical protein
MYDFAGTGDERGYGIWLMASGEITQSHGRKLFPSLWKKTTKCIMHDRTKRGLTP